jgi:hypothetical protein
MTNVTTSYGAIKPKTSYLPFWQDLAAILRWLQLASMPAWLSATQNTAGEWTVRCLLCGKECTPEHLAGRAHQNKFV